MHKQVHDTNALQIICNILQEQEMVSESQAAWDVQLQEVHIQMSRTDERKQEMFCTVLDGLPPPDHTKICTPHIII